MKILLTRTLGNAEKSAWRLAQSGFAAVILPLLRYCPVAGYTIPRRKFDAIVLTSAHATTALDAKSLGTNLPSRAYCVGPATADAAAAAGFEPVRPERADAEGLIARLRADIAAAILPAQPALLYLSGRHVSHDFSSGLPEAHVVRVVVYEMKAIDPGRDRLAAAIGATNRGAALLYSARTAMQLVRLCQKYGLVEALCRLTLVVISEKVARTIPWDNVRIVIADSPDEPGMIAALRAATETHAPARTGRDE